MDKINKKYKITKVLEKQILNKKDTRIKIYRKDKKKMDIEDLKEFYKYVKDNDKKGKYEVLIQGRNNIRMSTIKPFTENNIVDKDEEYYNRNGGDIDTDYFYIEIYLRETVKPKRI